MEDDLAASVELSRQALPVERELGNRRAEAITLGNLGIAWFALGEFGRARHYMDEGLRLTRAVGDLASETNPLLNLSQLALLEGDAAQALAFGQEALDVAVAVQDPQAETLALCRRGDAELALGRFAAAAASFERAHAVALAIDDVLQHEAAAGLARLALVRGDATDGLKPVTDLLAYLSAGGTLEGTEQPYLIWLICHQVLLRTGDPRAPRMLASAHAALQSRAAAISDPALRQGFLANIPEHREIVAAWKNAHKEAGGAE